ncbi:MAG: fluoride efflux transporter CrcB [Candidatus Obscuribacterales bacterium]|nr:fluoride efflux transporter CrcB [Candidatus Obscuribacterales bacterium]
MQFLYVFLGAGLGGVCRYFSSTNLHKFFPELGFPIGTFFVNMVGCFFIGLIAQLAETKTALGGDVRLFLTVGVLGGFTTFSSFGYETVQLIKDGEIWLALLNAFGQLALGLVFVWLGIVIARLL